MMLALITAEPNGALLMVSFRKDADGRMREWTTVTGDAERVRAAIAAGQRIARVLAGAGRA